MKHRNISLVAGIVFFLILKTAKALDMSSPPEDRATREALLQFAYLSAVVLSGVEIYATDRREFPGSIADLCGGPYLPVSCDTLNNPYTGHRLSGSNQAGEVEFTQGGKNLTLTFHIQPGKDIVMNFDDPGRFLYCEFPETGQMMPRCPPLERFRALDTASKRAYAVGQFVWASIAFMVSYERHTLFPRLKIQPPISIGAFKAKIQSYHDEWINAGTVASKKTGTGWTVGSHWIEWGNLLNDFSGGPAREVSVPSPGNFHYYKNPADGEWYLEAYGSGGEVVFREAVR